MTTHPILWPQFWDQPSGDLSPIAKDVVRMFGEIDHIGRSDSSAGYSRLAWTEEDLLLRQWFVVTAEELGLTVSVDNAGNQWAWWGEPSSRNPGFSTGSHLDSVPDGGAFDGPLGVISAFAAVAQMQREGIEPSIPLAVTNFSDEEGGRFGVACIGSRVLTGARNAAEVREFADVNGIRLGEAIGEMSHYGSDLERLALTRTHIELHVEQGYALDALGQPVGLATHIWPHGRWRVTVHGEPNHAGTTPMDMRNDALVMASELIQDLPRLADKTDCRATVGRMSVEPGGTNVIPGSVTMWIDIRGPEANNIQALLDGLQKWNMVQESWTEATYFDPSLLQDMEKATGAPAIGTAAGHDAGILQNAGIPTGMIFVRNATGASHTPAEFATLADCCAGVESLLEVIDQLGESHAASLV